MPSSPRHMMPPRHPGVSRAPMGGALAGGGYYGGPGLYGKNSHDDDASYNSAEEKCSRQGPPSVIAPRRRDGEDDDRTAISSVSGATGLTGDDDDDDHDDISTLSGLQDHFANTARTPQVELMPGVYEPIRTAKEMCKAIAQDFFVPATCITCETSLFCIQDSKYVLCPSCRVVGPMEGDGDGHYGVGLGFTFQQLCSWQEDIMRKRTRQARRRTAHW